MAQDYVALLRSIWGDREWRERSPAAQHAYLMLLSHPDRNAAGVLSLTLPKWTRLAAGLTVEGLQASLEELDQSGFLVVDEDTQEVLVRSFIRRADVYKHIRLLMNALQKVGEVESERLRSALGQELVRIPRLAIPSNNERMAEEARTAQERLDGLASQLCDAPPDPPANSAGHGPADPMAHPMADGIAHPPRVGAGTGVGVGTGAVLGSCTSAENESLESNAHARKLTGLCSEHPGKPARNCTGCAADRKAAS